MSHREPRALLDLILRLYEEKNLDDMIALIECVIFERANKGQGFKEIRHAWSAQLDRFIEIWDNELPGLGDERAQKLTPEVKLAVKEMVGKAMATADEDVDEVPEVKKAERPKMTKSQRRAYDKIVAWLSSDRPFMTLRGYAGTGKSFLLQEIAELGYNFHFSAPTNKATKVLSAFLGSTCKTTYSLLGLRMVTNEDKTELGEMKRIPDLGNKPVLVIDEAGMIPKFMAEILKNICEEFGWRCLFVGDPAQLNPVKEPRSIVWGFPEPEDRALLTEVMRFDNQLLQLSITLRECLVDKRYPRSPIEADNDGREGVFVIGKPAFMRAIESMKLDDWKTTKVACWRNRTVDEYTRVIRKALGFKGEFDEGDMIMMASPVIGEQGQILAFVDEEFQIKAITERRFEFDEGIVDARAITLHDSWLTLYVPEDPSSLNEILNKRNRKASLEKNPHVRKMLWSKFWELKNKFHDIRHGYAMTVHRLQGTTLDNVFVDQADILANHNERESFRCLYVAATRPRFKLITY